MRLVHMRRGYKTELDPNGHQRSAFVRWSGVSRWVYNRGLDRKIEVYRNTGKSVSNYSLKTEWRAARRRSVWLREPSCWVADSALEDLDKAFSNFYRRLKDGKAKPGFPQFKSRSRDGMKFTLRQIKQVHKDRIKLPKIGWVRLKERDYLPTDEVKYLTATVSERAGRWFVSLLVEEQSKPTPPNDGPVIGVDLGLKNWVILADGTTYALPRATRRDEKKLARLHRSVSRKQKGSRNREKAKRRLAREHYRWSNKRKDACHKLTTYLAKNHGLVAVEDLAVSSMMKNHSLARRIQESCWREVRFQLSYKCEWYGSELVVVDRWYPSTKTCSGCGNIKDKVPLDIRIYECDECGLVIDRDHNAAINIARVGATRSNACGDGKVHASAGGRLRSKKRGDLQFSR